MSFAASPIETRGSSRGAFSARLQKLADQVDRGEGSRPISGDRGAVLPGGEGSSSHEKIASQLEALADMPGASVALQGRTLEHDKVASDIESALGSDDRTREALEKIAYIMVMAEAEETILSGADS